MQFSIIFTFIYSSIHSYLIDHSNHILMDNVFGPVIISLLREHYQKCHYFRFLIRTQFSIKSLVIPEDFIYDTTGLGEISTSKLLAIAIHHFLEHEKEKERAMDDNMASSSIRSGMSSMSGKSTRTRFLPHARLKDYSPPPLSILYPSEPLSNFFNSNNNENNNQKIWIIDDDKSGKRNVQSTERHAHSIKNEQKNPLSTSQFQLDHGISLRKRLRTLFRMRTSELVHKFIMVKEKSFMDQLLSIDIGMVIEGNRNYDIIFVDDKNINFSPDNGDNNDNFLRIFGKSITIESISKQKKREMGKNSSFGSNSNQNTNFMTASNANVFSSSIDERGGRKNMIKLENIVNNLYEVCKNYLDNLDILCQYFIKPLKGRTDILSITNQVLIFDDLEIAWKEHRCLVRDISNDKSNIIEIIKKFIQNHGNLFEFYQRYSETHDERIKVFNYELKHNKKLLEFHEDVLFDGITKRRPLDQFLIAPINHFGHLLLCLKDFIPFCHVDSLKFLHSFPSSPSPSTPISPSSLSHLNELIELLQDIVFKMNEATESREMIKKIMELPSKIINFPVISVCSSLFLGRIDKFKKKFYNESCSISIKFPRNYSKRRENDFVSAE